jgi:hypothetical protein
MPSKCETLSSNPSTAKKERRVEGGDEYLRGAEARTSSSSYSKFSGCRIVAVISQFNVKNVIVVLPKCSLWKSEGGKGYSGGEWESLISLKAAHMVLS